MMYKNILIPVSFDEGHDTQASFVIAKTLADKGAKFTVVHVLEIVPTYMTAGIPQDIFKNNRRTRGDALEDVAKGLQGAEPVMIQGNPGREIVDYATKNDVDCIIIASHKLGLSDIFLGSTASKVVRHAKCSVHVIR